MGRVHQNLVACAGLIACVAGLAEAQRFQGAYGQRPSINTAFDIEQTEDGGYVTVGTADSGFGDVEVTRYDAVGNVVWSNRYDSGDRQSGWTITRCREGGFAVGGTISRAIPGSNERWENLIIRLRDDGVPVWSRQYNGTRFTDAIHAPDPGTSIIQASNGDLLMTGNRLGNPMILRVDQATGAFILAAEYVRPPSDMSVAGFTDIVELPDGSFVASGTVARMDATGFLGDRNVLALRVAPNLAVITSGVYGAFNGKDGAQFPPSETGNGITRAFEGELLAISGNTDYGYPAGFGLPSQIAPHLLVIDPPSLTPLAWTGYDPLAGAPPQFGDTVLWTNDYQAVDWDRRSGGFILGGTEERERENFTPRASMHKVDPGLNSEWTSRYGRFTTGRSAIAADRAECGFALGGEAFDPFPGGGILGPAAKYVVKTNDGGESGCFEDKLDLPGFPVELEFRQPDYRAAYLDGDRDVPLDPIEGIREELLCQDDDCVDGPCRPDLNGDGILDVFDIIAFFGLFGAMNPTADWNNDGVFNIFDILAYFDAFAAGC